MVRWTREQFQATVQPNELGALLPQWAHSDPLVDALADTVDLGHPLTGQEVRQTIETMHRMGYRWCYFGHDELSDNLLFDLLAIEGLRVTVGSESVLVEWGK